MLAAMLQGTVQGVTVRSQVTPDYTYDPWAPSPPPTEGQAWLMQLVKPEVILHTAGGDMSIAPYGPPTESYGLLAAAGGVATLVGAIMLIGWIARATK